MFDITQKQIKSQILKPRLKQKEFAFTKIMTCGLCGSGITADEKFKHQKNGNVHRYVYYKCTKVKDPHCKCGLINENDLIKRLIELINTIHIDEIGMKEKIKIEIQQYKKFQESVLGKVSNEKIKVKEIDIRNYAKYILKERSIWEKRELLNHLRSKLLLENKIVILV